MKLLEPTTLGPYALKNHMVMAAMTRSRANTSGVVGPLTVEYYAQRASAGLIISEAINISPDAIGSPLTPASTRRNRLPPGSRSPTPCMPKEGSSTPSSGTRAGSRIRWNGVANCPRHRLP